MCIRDSIVESGTKTAKVVKSHHNVGGLPEDLQFSLVEPLYYLFKDEVRACGVELGPVSYTHLSSEEEFYTIFLEKWKEYLYRIRSGKHLRAVLGKDLETVEDVKEHMEEIKIYLRGHNLFDIFYGRYKSREQEILRQYVDCLLYTSRCV